MSFRWVLRRRAGWTWRTSTRETPRTWMQRLYAQENRRSYAWHPHNLTQPPGLYRLLQPVTIKTPMAAAKVTIFRNIKTLWMRWRDTTSTAANEAGASAPRQHVCPLGADARVELLARPRHARKAVAPRPRFAGVNDHARIARIVTAVSHGVERRTPAAAQGLDAFARIEARAHRPYHLIHVGGIDVLIDHHHETVGVSPSMALRGDEPSLLGVTGILLLDRDGEPQPTAAGRMRPYAFHFRHASRFKLVPHSAGPVGAAIEGIIIGRYRRNCAQQDGLIAVHERFDADRRLFFRTAGVIAGPLAERPFLQEIVGMNEALEGDLRMRRYRQTRHWPVDYLDRLANQTAGDVIFVFSIGDLESPNHEQRRMHSRDHGDRTGLTALVVATLDQIAVFAFGAHDRCHVGPLRLHAISAVVDPAGVRILHDHHAAGADVVAAVVLVPARCRNALNVDVLAATDVLHQRSGFDGDRGYAARLLHVFAPVGDKLDRGAVHRHSYREIDAPH